MTPLKQQISLIPFSIQHTGIALKSDGVLKIVLYLANYRCSVWVQTSANANIRNKSDPGFVFGLILIRMSVVSVPKLWMHYLVSVSHFAKYGTNRLLIVWKFRKQRNANKCPKIAHSSVVKKMKVIRNPRADPHHHQKSTTSRASSLARACQVWSTSVSAFVSYPVYRLTEWQTEWQK